MNMGGNSWEGITRGGIMGGEAGGGGGTGFPQVWNPPGIFDGRGHWEGCRTLHDGGECCFPQL